MLEHSDLFLSNDIFKEIAKRFKAVSWTIKDRHKRIHLTREIINMKPTVRILRAEFTTTERLILQTTHGELDFYNP